jgi:hypothetical protein
MPGRFERVIPVVSSSGGSEVPEAAKLLSEVEQDMWRPEAVVLAYSGSAMNGRLSQWSAPPDLTQLTKDKSRPRAAIDKVAAVPVKEVLQSGQRAVAIPQANLITVAGWAAADGDGRAGGVFVVVDDDLHVWALVRGSQIESESPSETSTAQSRDRFEVAIPGETLAPGEHTLSLMVLTPDGRSYQETKPISIEVGALPRNQPRVRSAAGIDGE